MPIPSDSVKAMPSDKCWSCKKPAVFVVGRVTKKVWCAGGHYTRKGTGWCLDCWEASVKEEDARRSAVEVRRAELKQLREWKRENNIPITDEDYPDN